MFAVANGEIVAVQERADGSDAVIIRHFVPLQALPNAQPSLERAGTTEVFSVYINIDASNEPLDTQNSLDEPIAIGLGDQLGVIAASTTVAHLHFEIRTIEPQINDLYPNDNGGERYATCLLYTSPSPRDRG